ncbi:diguanylate cyclase [Vibrio sp. S17_S38]|uniref:sensor domain-containing diguanylate cyclase n=1 Tax=Vibrio sp. S17_S38 TaxID=2720229 RepID=UPI0016812E75|nr:sensor domain-containing diguanylate cyclase [Vibrio sp. S17_S38]MBD1573390.1 diguanylate cyclase [Vibrio sp. S17_S38]
MLVLDNRTLLIVIVLISIGSAIALTFLWRVQNQRNGVGFWSAGMSLIALASLLISGRGYIPDFISIIIANLCYILGFLIISRGILVFIGRKPILFFDVSLLAVATSLFYYFHYIEHNQNIRIVVFSAIILIICIAIVMSLLTINNQEQRSSGHGVATVFALFGLFNFMRGIMAFLFPSEQSVIENSLSTTLLYLSAIFLIGGIAITLILQTYSVLSSRLRTLSLAIEQSASSIVITDSNWIIEYVNPRVLEKTGYREEELIGQSAGIFSTELFVQTEKEHISKVLNAGEIWRGELLTNSKYEGNEFWELASIAPVKQANGQIEHFVAVMEDITMQKEAKKQIQHLAYHDSLTGLPTRQLMMKSLEKALSSALQEKVAVLFLDLDGFKSVNDNFGHAAGDELLKIATDKLRSCVRDNDMVARIGGDEFLIVITQVVGGTMLSSVATRMINTLSRPFHINNIEVSVSASIGIAMYPEDSQDPEELIKLADHAMYDVKRKGKNNFAFVDKTDHSPNE